MKDDKVRLAEKIDERLKERVSELRSLFLEMRNSLPDHTDQIGLLNENQGIMSQSLAFLESNFNKKLNNLRKTMYVLEKTLNLTLTGESRLRKMKLPGTDLEIEPYRTEYY